MKKTVKANSAVRRWIMTVVFLTMIVGLVSACGDEGSKGTDGNSGSAKGDDSKLKITTTTGMIADTVANVGGVHVEVEGLMGPGIDPHLFKASQGDVRKLDGADLIFYNGLHLEGKMGEIFERLEGKKPVVAVASKVEGNNLLNDPEGQGEAIHDPHIWFDVKLWMSAVEVIRDTLVEADPDHAEDYKKQAAQYLEEMEKLDAYAKEQIATIPEKSRVLVTAHDAFGYFGNAYGLTVRGLQGMNTMSEFGSRDVAELRDYLVENKIKAVFIESSVSTDSIESVIEGAGKLGHKVVVGGELFSDAMGEAGTNEGTYLGMVKHNVDTIVNALK
ncbi:metal ABC transporter solute-binding protein, Zn/Mn family [Paenibacillus chungangensis]|uniref:Metal ABC transporter solute-binding protein, Zn/Mn family n=1 Tax=Paenibacillus chungangensis TaxID=696535 RepID=A0ABW3HSM9_9BACL